jgi:hypothetical protein
VGDPNKEFNIEPVGPVSFNVYHETKPDIVYLDFDMPVKRVGFDVGGCLKLAEVLIKHAEELQK